MTDVDVDVAVVGAGPVGLVLAVLLGQRDRSVAVLEQWPEPYPLPRAVHFDHEVGRIIQACGIGAEVRAVSEPAEVYEWRNGQGTTLLRFGRVGVAASGWPFSSMFCQPDVEAVLRDRAESLPSVTVQRGTRVHDIVHHDDHVVVSHTGGDLRASYVVGCDGANSTVRDLLGIGVDDRGFHFDWLIVDVILAEPRVFDPINVQVCDPERPTTAVSGGPGRRRWEFMRLPEESLQELGREERAWELLAPWDVHPGNARLERHAVYTFQARVAERWQAGRALLAGDAAHLMPPFAGQGMCSGLRDAANLAWKLDLVLDGRADAELLASYDEERRPSANAAVDFSIELGRVICVPDPAEAAARDEAMAAAYDGEVSEAPGLPGIACGVVLEGSPQAGEQLPQGIVDGRLFDDVHGAGWRLVTVAASSALDPELVAWFATIGGEVVDVAGRSPDLEAWFARHDLRGALQRPDFHLFGTSAAVDGTNTLLAELRQHLRRTP
ncbi:MAG TPA: bifunctional 3-(3-hydroxy-phenyl)propionate/3-hydroxycinnamic acid hydroxylase [Iamia sp.]